MDSTVIVALLSCMGTVIGSMFGVVASSNKMIYRIEQLEKKVEKHNSMVERMRLKTSSSLISIRSMI